MMDDKIGMLLQPRELVIILRAEINAFIVGNPKPTLSKEGKAARCGAEKAAGT